MADLAARCRAARAWAGLEQAELGELLGVDRQTVARRERGTQEPKRGDLLAIATACKVPPSFMLNGWGDAEWVAGNPEFVLELEHDLAEIREQLSKVVVALDPATASGDGKLDLTAGQFPTRAVSESLKDRLPPVDSESESVADSRDGEGATEEAAQPPREANQ